MGRRGAIGRAAGRVRALPAGLVIVAVATLFVRDGAASTSIAVSLDALVLGSSAAAFVTPVTQNSRWEAGRIFTYTDVHVDDLVAGEPAGDALTIRTMGGDVGHIGQVVEGEAVLTVGRPSLLFVHPAAAITPSTASSPAEPGASTFVVTGRAQGQFPVTLDSHGDLRVRTSSGVGPTLPPRARLRSGETLAAPALQGLKTTEAEAAVARAWAQHRAR
jgi:hypothetical protein